MYTSLDRIGSNNRFERSRVTRVVICHRKWQRTRVREASQSHAFDSPVSSEYMDVRTARPDEE